MLHLLGALYGFMRLFFILPSLPYDFTSKNFPGLLYYIGAAENRGCETRDTKFIEISQIYKTDSTFFQVTKGLLSKSDIFGIISIDKVERRSVVD